jgi:flagellar basal body-associated protein FliL
MTSGGIVVGGGTVVVVVLVAVVLVAGSAVVVAAVVPLHADATRASAAKAPRRRVSWVIRIDSCT